jgi:hypothetical protein
MAGSPTAFQKNAFQNNAFQISTASPPSPAFGPRAPTGKIMTLDVVQGYIFGSYPLQNESCQMILYLGGGLTTGNIQLTFTRPAGGIQYGDSAFAYVGNIPIAQIYTSSFPAKQYIGYTFAMNELFETGTWTVIAGMADYISNPVPFQVVPFGVQ